MLWSLCITCDPLELTRKVLVNRDNFGIVKDKDLNGKIHSNIFSRKTYGLNLTQHALLLRSSPAPSDDELICGHKVWTSCLPLGQLKISDLVSYFEKLPSTRLCSVQWLIVLDISASLSLSYPAIFGCVHFFSFVTFTFSNAVQLSRNHMVGLHFSF